MSIIQKLKEHYGKDLPGKSAFRNDSENPYTLQEVYEKFGSWDNFVAEYTKPAPAKAAPSKQPAVKTGDANDKAK